MVQRHDFIVGPEGSGERLDVYLARHLRELSRSQLQRLIRSGEVKVNNAVAGKPRLELRAGDKISFQAEPKSLGAVAEDLPLSILYEDDDIAVVNKAAGMTVHAGAGAESGTLANAALHHFGKLSRAGGDLRPGIVHRLDKMTSGLVIVAKNDAAHAELAAQFKSREVQKTYLALVHGRVASDAGDIVKPVGRDPVRRVRMKAGGIRPRQAFTHYKVVKRFGDFTLVEAEPKTGRTHQIRVHFASIGHPVVGDTLYGAPRKLNRAGQAEKTLGRNFLHASKIEFRQPSSGKAIHFEAPLPPELQDFLLAIERSSRPAQTSSNAKD